MDVSSTSFLENGSVFEQEYHLEFHGQQYVVNLEATASLLRLEVEQNSSNNNDFWSGEFTSQYIEEITHKAGNHKKFGVFVKMLCSALARDSDSVFIDFLTYSDLEQLKARKLGTSISSTHRNVSKRYFILTYNNEFDRVHFPLPVSLQDTPSIEALRRVISRLRRRLAEKEKELVAPSSVKEREQQQILSLLRQENTELKHRLRQLESREQSASASTTTATHKYISKIEKLKRDLSDATTAYDKLRHDSAREITKLKHKLTSTSNATSDKLILALKRQVQNQKNEIESLKQKLSQSKTGTSSTYSSRRYSRSASPNRSTASASHHSSYHKPPTSTTATRNRRSSSPASSSLGNRFDPTAYVKARQEKSRGRSSTFGSSRRYSDTESGYSSAASNSSAGSRRSNRSNVSNRSSASKNSDKAASSSAKKRKQKRKSSKDKQKHHSEIPSVTSQLLPTASHHSSYRKSSSSRYSDRFDDDVVNYYDATLPKRSVANTYVSAYESDDESIEPHYDRHTSPAVSLPAPADSAHDKSSSILQMSKEMRKSLEKEATVTPAAATPVNNSAAPIPKSSHSNSKVQSSVEVVKSVEVIAVATPPPVASVKNENESISDIDKRISALQKFLDKARSGILAEVDINKASIV